MVSCILLHFLVISYKGFIVVAAVFVVIFTVVLVVLALMVLVAVLRLHSTPVKPSNSMIQCTGRPSCEPLCFDEPGQTPRRNGPQTWLLTHTQCPGKIHVFSSLKATRSTRVDCMGGPYTTCTCQPAKVRYKRHTIDYWQLTELMEHVFWV